MSANENETIAGISEEFRRLSDTAKDGIIAVKGNAIADRIDAAWKRDERHALEHATAHAEAVARGNCRDCIYNPQSENYEGGNAAAMRAELEEIVGIVSEWQGSIPLGKVCKIAKAALSKPPRNCDRFNNEREMQFAFLAELLSMGRNGATLEEYSKWLLDEAKGAGNESK